MSVGKSNPNGGKTMKKAAILILLFLALSVAVNAETTVTTSINLTYYNETFRLQSEGLDVTYTSSNQTQTATSRLNLSRNLTTPTSSNNLNQTTIDNLASTTQQMTLILKDSQNYFNLYTACYTNLTIASTRLEDCRNKPTFENELNTCKTDLASQKGTTLSEQQIRISCETQLLGTIARLDWKINDTQELIIRNKDLAGQRWIFAATALVAGIAATLWYLRYKNRIIALTQRIPK